MTTVQQVAEAFVGSKVARCGNATTDGVTYRLHGNIIAIDTPEGILFNWCGWYTPTTANHMNEILRAMYAGGGKSWTKVSYSAARTSGQTTFNVER